MEFPSHYPINQFIKHLHQLWQHYEQGVPIEFAEKQIQDNLNTIKENLVQLIHRNVQVFKVFNYRVYPLIAVDSIAPALQNHTYRFQYQEKYHIKIEIISNKVHSIEVSNVLVPANGTIPNNAPSLPSLPSLPPLPSLSISWPNTSLPDLDLGEDMIKINQLGDWLSKI